MLGMVGGVGVRRGAVSSRSNETILMVAPP
jgi:hypothetical protein